MKIVKEKIAGNKKNLNSVELIDDDKHMKMSLSDLGFLNVSFFYDNPNKDLWFQEKFEISKSDGDIYDLVDSLFFASGDVFFSTEGSNMQLINDSNRYRFYFVRDLDSKKISCTFIDSSIENDKLKRMFVELQDSKYDTQVKKESNKRLAKVNKSKKNIEN